MRYRRRLKPFVESFAGKSRKRHLMFITFTWRQGEFEITPAWVKGALRQVAKVIRKFYCLKSKHGHKLGGALAVLEMSPVGFFHVHCLVYGYYVPIKRVRAFWWKVTKGSFIVDMRDTEGHGTAALDELIKYIVKPISARCPNCGRSLKPNETICRGNYDNEGIFHDCLTLVKIDQEQIVDMVARYLSAIKGRRRIHTWGIFYNAQALKIVHRPGLCPFCGSPLQLVTDHAIDDGSYWPIWAILEAVRAGPDAAPLPVRYA